MAALSLISGYPFVHATCAIYIINVFHSVNVTLRTVISIHDIQKMDQKQLETRKQDENCCRTSRRTIQILK